MNRKSSGLVDDSSTQIIASLKKGGLIKQTGIYKLHKGEKVVPKKKGKKNK